MGTRSHSNRSRARLLGFLLVAIVPAGAGRVHADGVTNVLPATSSAPPTVFPNWVRVHVGEFTVAVCDDLTCPFCLDGPITGLTLLNFGTCTGSPGTDIVGVYFQFQCTKTDSGTLAMTYAGPWTVAGLPRAAWTWGGSIPWASDPYSGTGGCAGSPTLSVYVDFGGCAIDGCTIMPVVPFLGLSDACDFFADISYDAQEVLRTVRYVGKIADRDTVAPGDTVTYTIFYGRPGAAALSGVTVFDTLPLDTTYIAGSGVPAPDPGWDPDIGPPLRLRWALPGTGTAGGATQEVRFSVSVDWGNEPYDPGSGYQAAVEGVRLGNRANVEYLGASCAARTHTSGEVGPTVRRYLMWIIGDQDLLFAGRVGMPDDEVVYEMFVSNESASRTWWDVTFWDTVPSELTVWGDSLGFDDPCVGWTMTPTACAAASPGWYAPGPGTSVLTWTIDLPPRATMSIRWKGRVGANAQDGSTALNIMAMMAKGRQGVGGSGSARAPRAFVHLAPIVLRTTYFSYVGHSASTGCSGDFIINFYPLNKSTDFEFRKLEYNNVPYATVGGVSASINTFVGSCVAGFAESLLGSPGCKVERVPAQYYRECGWVAEPYTYAYKLTSNAPVIWMYMWANGWNSGDCITFLPSTTLSFAGWTLYTWRRGLSDTVGEGDNNAVINTGQTPAGAYDPAQGTTVHVFRWDATALAWSYVKSADLDGESAWVPIPGTLDSQVGHYRFISSNTKLVVWQGYNLPINGQNDHGTQVPNSRTGLLVSPPGGPAHFYAMLKPNANPMCMTVGNVQPGNPTTFKIWKYRSLNPAASPGVTAAMAGASGTWRALGTRTVGAGLNDPANGYVFGTGYDVMLQDPDSQDSLYKVEWLSGGRVQVHGGAMLWDGFSGGSQLHGSGGTAGTGQEFWIHTVGNTDSSWCSKGNGSPYNVMVFCPASGMVVHSESGPPATGGAYDTYTTTGPDQVVCFMGQTEMTAVPSKRNWRYWLDAGGKQGDLMALYTQCRFGEKFYAAPFTHAGQHYTIICPPTAYVGQSFWITVVAVGAAGATETDYCGTTSFTSTDPGAKISAQPMDTLNYTWDSNDPAASCQGAGCTGGCDNGVRLFFNVSFTQLGFQTLIATDIVDGSVSGLASLLVVGVDVKFTKEKALQIAASSDTVRFKICWSNYSSGSAFTFVISDAVPLGTTFLPEASANGLNCGNTAGIALAVAYSTLNVPTLPPAASFTTANPVAGTRWLRWTVPVVGVMTSGCACYRVTVN